MNQISLKEKGRELSLKEAAKLIGVHEETLRRWATQKYGPVRSYKKGPSRCAPRVFFKNELIEDVYKRDARETRGTKNIK